MKQHIRSERHFALAASYPSDVEARHQRHLAEYINDPAVMRVTPTGIVIGCAYQRPMPVPSTDSEVLQKALLKNRVPRSNAPILTRYSVVAVLVLIALAVVAAGR